MNHIRVIYIPPLKVVSSGAINTIEELRAFDQWWSAIDMTSYITPRDFMWFNEKLNAMEWVVAVPDDLTEFGNYQLANFPGGLYAVATSKDSEEDSMVVQNNIKDWINNSKVFVISSCENDTVERYEMCHVITPKIFKEKMGYHLSDYFVPIIALR